MPSDPPRGSLRARLARTAVIAVALVTAQTLVTPTRLAAQGVPATPAPAATPDSGSMVGAIRAFLDCRGDTDLGCALDWFISEFGYVTWTRDRLFADVQFLVTTIQMGSGGFEYTITGLGRGRFAGRADTSVVRPVPNESEARVRERLGRAIALMLVPYVRTTPQANALVVTWERPKGQAATLSPESVRDPWHFWTFEIEGNGFARGESRQSFLDLFGDVRARRVTERWNVRTGYFGSYATQRFQLGTGEDRTIVRNILRRGTAFGRAVRSLGPHWSAGVIANAGFDEFRNTRLVLRAAPVIEYNVFPWRDATRRQLAFSYGIGPRHFVFADTSIFGNLRETRLQQEFVIGSDVRQSWGSINLTTRYASFVPDMRLWNLGVDGGVSLNLVKGLSLNVGGGAAYIRDQNFLARRGQTREEILTQQRALATNFRYFASVGFNYTFGSIYNSVVNPRLDFFTLGGN